MVKVVAVGTDATINFVSSKLLSVKVDPTAVTPLTASNLTISPSFKPVVPGDVTVTVVEELVLVKLQPVNVVLIGCMS